MKRGVDEHELFHRGDFLDKFGPTRRARKTVREKWKDVRKMLAEMEKYERYIDEDHPLRIARDMLIGQGYDPLESMLALWRKNPEQFKRIIKLATAAHVMEKRGQASEKTRRMKRLAKTFFSSTPKKASRTRTIYDVSTEVPAYMITAMVERKRPEKGIAIASRKMIKNAAEAVKLGLFKAEEIRTALAAQALSKMDQRAKTGAKNY